MPGISTSSSATSGWLLASRVDDLVAAGHLGDDLEVVLELEQRCEGTAHECLVVGEQQADHAGTFTVSEKPRSPGPAPVVTVAPARRAR